MITIKRTTRLPNFVNESDWFVVRAVNSGHDKAGLMIKNDLVRRLTTGKRTGRIYGSHQASAAGEYPAKMTGKLAESVKIENSNLRLTIGEAADYAQYLEIGTAKMAARPHLRPSVEGNMPNVIKIVSQELDKLFK